jgi:hypothetical protein
MPPVPEDDRPAVLSSASEDRGQARRSNREDDPDLDALHSLGDRELILWSHSLSLEARLEQLQDFVDTFWTPAHG